MKTLLLIALLAVPTFAQIQTRYDKFNDTTTVYTDGDTILATNRGRAPVTRVVMVSGFVADDFFLSFRVIYSRSWAFLKYNDLTFLIDGERVEMGKAKWEGDAANGHERVWFATDRATLTRIANGKVVELQLGLFEAKLDEKQKKNIKELLDYEVK